MEDEEARASMLARNTKQLTDLLNTTDKPRKSSAASMVLPANNRHTMPLAQSAENSMVGQSATVGQKSMVIKSNRNSQRASGGLNRSALVPNAFQFGS